MQLVTVKSLKTEAHPQTKMMFWFLFSSSRGAQNRIKIIRQLQHQPLNTNQLSQELSIDYKAIKHHLRILEENNLIGKIEVSYGATYFIAPLFEENQNVFEEIASKFNL